MPTYEYKCNKCGHRFEKFQPITSSPVRKCPECGKNAVERLISAGGGLIFKGSGFYITDYRDASYNEKAKAESGHGKSDKPETATAAGGEAKPAADASKAESKPQSKPAEAPAAKSESKPESKPAKSESKPASKSSSRKA